MRQKNSWEITGEFVKATNPPMPPLERNGEKTREKAGRPLPSDGFVQGARRHIPQNKRCPAICPLGYRQNVFGLAKL